MQSDTRIFVFRLRQLLTALAVAVILILAAILAVFQFIPSKKDVQTSPASAYTAGIYTSSITLGSQSVDIQVVVDKDRVKSASIVNLDESVEDISYSSSSRYTSQVLLGAVSQAINKAR